MQPPGHDEPASSTTDEAALRASLERRFRTTTTPLALGGRTVALLHPASAEELISEEDFLRDERLPYWADVWPSSRVLAEAVLGEPGEGRPLLELGCGVGLVATAAALAGWAVTATDYYEDALAFARANAAANAGRRIATRLVDWRDLPADLGRFARVVASDVLYERPYAALVAETLAATLAPGGRATVADPGRVGAEAFVAECERRGLRVRAGEPIAWADGAVRQRIRLYDVEGGE